MIQVEWVLSHSTQIIYFQESRGLGDVYKRQTLNGDKPLSAQLFSRFIRICNLEYQIRIYDNEDKLVFQYKE